MGITQAEDRAMCMGRNHSQSTSARFYERVSLQRWAFRVRCAQTFIFLRSADLAQAHIDRLNQKRKAESETVDFTNPAPLKMQRRDNARDQSSSSSSYKSGKEEKEDPQQPIKKESKKPQVIEID